MSRVWRLNRVRIGTVATIVACSVTVFAFVVALAGADPFGALATLVTGGWRSSGAVWESFLKAGPILLCALAAALPGRAGYVNIGAEGQLLFGAVGATMIVQWAPQMPGGIMLTLMALSAMLGGALLGFVPGLLKAIVRANETVVSLLLNYVGGLMVMFLIHGPWKDPSSMGWPQTISYPEGAVLPAMVPGTRLHILIGVAAVLCAASWVLSRHSVFCFSLKVIKASEETANYIGVSAGKSAIMVFVAGGALAGLAGFGEVSGIHHRLREGISLGYGYSGFLVAWICGNRMGGIALMSLLFGALTVGADVLQVSAGLPFGSVYLLQGVVFFAVVIYGSIRRQIPAGGGL